MFEQRDTCKDWDKRLINVLDWMSEDGKERVWGIVYDEKGNPTPIFEDMKYYIMTENGNTYSKLTCPIGMNSK